MSNFRRMLGKELSRHESYRPRDITSQHAIIFGRRGRRATLERAWLLKSLIYFSLASRLQGIMIALIS